MGWLAPQVVGLYHMGSAISDKSIKLVPGHGYNLFQALRGVFTHRKKRSENVNKQIPHEVQVA